MLPLWSAAVDPRVLFVRTVGAGSAHDRDFPGDYAAVRSVRSSTVEHLLFDRGGAPIRVDVIETIAQVGPAVPRFELPDDCHLEARIAAIRQLRGGRPRARHDRLARRAVALQALDLRLAHASLRQVADAVLGPGDWPGEGEHRKSLVRRMIVVADFMVRAGPGAVLRS